MYCKKWMCQASTQCPCPAPTWGMNYCSTESLSCVLVLTVAQWLEVLLSPICIDVWLLPPISVPSFSVMVQGVQASVWLYPLCGGPNSERAPWPGPPPGLLPSRTPLFLLLQRLHRQGPSHYMTGEDRSFSLVPGISQIKMFHNNSCKDTFLPQDQC